MNNELENLDDKPRRLFGKFDIVLITLLLATAVAAVSPVEVGSVVHPSNPFDLFFVVLGLSLGLCAVAFIRGLYPFAFQWTRPIKGRLVVALVYGICVIIAVKISPVRDHVNVERAEHVWNWIRSLSLRPVTNVDNSSKCMNLSGRGAVVVSQRPQFGGECTSEIIQYDTPENPVCTRFLQTSAKNPSPLPKYDPRKYDLSWSETKISDSLASVLICAIL